MQVLIADDDLTYRRMLEALLKNGDMNPSLPEMENKPGKFCGLRRLPNWPSSTG